MSHDDDPGDIPEGEVRPISRDTFRKQLPRANYDLAEVAEEACQLDYTPCINRKQGLCWRVWR